MLIQIPRVAGWLPVLLLAGCGLAMDSDDRLARAEAAFAKGEYVSAAIDAKNVLQEQPDNRQARVLLGRASLQMNDAVSGETEFLKALELGIPVEDIAIDLANALLLQGRFQEMLDSNYPRDRMTASDLLSLDIARGNALLALGETGKARETYSSVLESSPENLDALLGIASAYVRDEDAANARAVLEQVFGIDAELARVWLFSGNLNRLIGDLEQAKADFEKALALADADADSGRRSQALIALTEIHLTLEENDKARKTVNALKKERGASLSTLMLEARVAYAEGNLDVAQEQLQTVLSAGDFYPAKILLGAVHLKKRNFAQAEAYLASAVAEAPENANARQLLAQARLRMRRFDEAQEVLAPLTVGASVDTTSLTLAAITSLDQQNYDKAVEYLRQGIAAEPGNDNLKFQLVFALLAANRLQEADETIAEIESNPSGTSDFQRDTVRVLYTLRSGENAAALRYAIQLAEKWGDRPAAHSLLGQVYLTDGNFADARRSLAKAAHLDSGNDDVIRFQALVEEKAGDDDAARIFYEKALASGNDVGWAQLGLARVAYVAGDHVTARQWLERAVSESPNRAGAAAALAGLHISSGNFSEADSVLKTALATHGNSAELHNLFGVLEFQRKRFDSAKKAFKQATELKPDIGEFKINLALSEAFSGNTIVALRMLEEQGDVVLDRLWAGVMLASLKAGVGDPESGLRIARALQGKFSATSVPIALEAEIHALQGNLELAEAAYDRALGLDQTPRNALGAYRIRRQQDSPNALRTLEAYLESKPDDVDVRLVLADALGSENNVRAAIREYERVVQLSPANGAALNNLAWSYYLVQDQRAEETARRAFEYFANSGAVADTYGWILVQNQKLDEGAAVLAKAALMAPNNGEIRYHYGYALAKLGKASMAREELKAALEKRVSPTRRGEVEELLASLN